MRRTRGIAVCILIAVGIAAVLVTWRVLSGQRAAAFAAGISRLEAQLNTANLSFDATAATTPIGEAGPKLQMLRPESFGTCSGSVQIDRHGPGGRAAITVHATISLGRITSERLSIVTDPQTGDLIYQLGDLEPSPLRQQSVDDACSIIPSWAIGGWTLLLHRQSCAIVEPLRPQTVNGVRAIGVYLQRDPKDSCEGWERWWFDPETGRPVRFETGRYVSGWANQPNEWAGLFTLDFQRWEPRETKPAR